MSTLISSEAANSKILPSDKTGLPWEIWQMILSCLSASDLCHLACVCKSWNELVLSIDATHWKHLYLSCRNWRHPFWPLNTEADPPSWRLAYRDQHISTKFWRHRLKHETNQTSCTFFFKKPVLRKTICVGPGLEHETLKSAFGAATEYDQVMVYPGIYDEQFEISAKIPFELVGHGELGSVILVVGIQQVAISARLSNLVFRAPWFTSFIVMINSGYLQIENCILEDGMICAQHPSTVSIKFCTFRHATIILQNMNASVIENCEFSQSDSANIIIEGHPKGERNWTYPFLRDHTNAIFQQKRSLHRKKHGLKPTSSMTSTIHSSFTSKSLTTGYSAQIYDTISHDPSCNFDEPGASFLYPNVIPGRYLGSDRDGMVGCGDLQSMYQEPESSNTLLVKPDVSGHIKHKRNNSGTLSLTSDFVDYASMKNDPSSSYSKAENVSKMAPHESKLPENSRGETSTDSANSASASVLESDTITNLTSKSIRNNVRRKSLGSSSLQPVEEFPLVARYLQDVDQMNSQEVLKEEFVGTRLNVASTSDMGEGLKGSGMENQKAALKKKGRRKSVDSRVEFQLERESQENAISKLSQKADDEKSGNSESAFPNSKSFSKPSSSSQSYVEKDSSHVCHYTGDSGPIDSNNKGFREISQSQFYANTPSTSREMGLGAYHGHMSIPSVNLIPSECDNSGAGASGRSHLYYLDPPPAEPSLPPQQQPPNPLPQHLMRRSQSEEILPGSDDNLSSSDDLDDSPDSSGPEDYHGDSMSSSTDSSDINSINYTASDDGFSTSEESVIMLPHLREFHLDPSSNSASPRGVEAEITSINSNCTRPVPVNVSEDTLMNSYVGQIQGCLIHQCRMNHSKGGVMITLQAHAIIHECEINNVGYGIRCIQNSRAVILKNKIHHCRTSGIFMRLGASGLIAGNDIHSNNEAGIDIRKNADPLVQFNQIHHGKRSGIAVLGSGRGQIKKNDIYCNAEAGVYILYGGNPTVSENYIYEGRAAGVAVNAYGKGCIVDNVIRGNQWGGVDIRNGGFPLISGNSIINGLSDGIVMGKSGKGCIENNNITGNAGCGIWTISSKILYVHGNQICCSGHCGIMMLDKTASTFDSHMSQMSSDDLHPDNFSPHDIDMYHPGMQFSAAVLQYNNISHNRGQGILIEMKEEVHMSHNAIHGNSQDGIIMSQDAPALIKGNSISSNGGSGIVTSSQNETQILENGIYDNARYGLVCKNQCVMEANDIMGHSLPAVIVEPKASLKMTDNRLSSSSEPAVKACEYSTVEAEKNKIFDKGGGDFACQGLLKSTDNTLSRPTLMIKECNKKSYHKDTSERNDFLTDPPARPHAVPPPPPFTSIPPYQVTVVTKVTLPSSEGCDRGSKVCSVL